MKEQRQVIVYFYIQEIILSICDKFYQFNLLNVFYPNDQC